MKNLSKKASRKIKLYIFRALLESFVHNYRVSNLFSVLLSFIVIFIVIDTISLLLFDAGASVPMFWSAICLAIGWVAAIYTDRYLKEKEHKEILEALQRTIGPMFASGDRPQTIADKLPTSFNKHPIKFNDKTEHDNEEL